MALPANQAPLVLSSLLDIIITCITKPFYDFAGPVLLHQKFCCHILRQLSTSKRRYAEDCCYGFEVIAINVHNQEKSKGLVPTLIDFVFDTTVSLPSVAALPVDVVTVVFLTCLSFFEDAVAFKFCLFFGHDKNFLHQCPLPPQAAHMFIFFFGAIFLKLFFESRLVHNAYR